MTQKGLSIMLMYINFSGLLNPSVGKKWLVSSVYMFFLLDPYPFTLMTKANTFCQVPILAMLFSRNLSNLVQKIQQGK